MIVREASDDGLVLTFGNRGIPKEIMLGADGLEGLPGLDLGQKKRLGGLVVKGDGLTVRDHFLNPVEEVGFEVGVPPVLFFPLEFGFFRFVTTFIEFRR